MASPSPSPALPPAPWDPLLLPALHAAHMPNNYTRGGDWYMDTGVTTHMFAHHDNLASFTPVTTDRRIIVGDGSTLPITHIGTLIFLLVLLHYLCLTYLCHLILLRILFPFIV